MIKFFRKIRQAMIKENRVSKYMLYAFGEIVLVVVGILIALQINNWNEERKSQLDELKLMQQLSEDLRADSLFFDSRLTGIEAQIEVLENLKQMCNGSLDDAEQYKILESTQNPFTRYAMQSSVVNEELDLSAISNDEIRNFFRQYRSKYEYVQKSGTQHNKMASENFFAMAKLNPTMLEVDSDSNSLNHYRAFCDYPNIEGIIGLQIRTILLFSENIERFTKLNVSLSAEIEQYIERNQ